MTLWEGNVLNRVPPCDKYAWCILPQQGPSDLPWYWTSLKSILPYRTWPLTVQGHSTPMLVTSGGQDYRSFKICSPEDPLPPQYWHIFVIEAHLFTHLTGMLPCFGHTFITALWTIKNLISMMKIFIFEREKWLVSNIDYSIILE